MLDSEVEVALSDPALWSLLTVVSALSQHGIDPWEVTHRISLKGEEQVKRLYLAQARGCLPA